MKKRFTALFLATVLLVSVFTGCASSSDEIDGDSSQTYTIAVVWHGIDETTQMRANYLADELGPALGLEFIFSEEIVEPDQLMTFIENAYASGADAVLSTFTDAIEQYASKCDELGLYLAIQTSRYPDEVASLPYFMGISGVDISKVGDAYAELLSNNIDPNEKRNFIVVTGGAAMGVTSHMEATSSMLKQLQEIYGLTYEMDIDELTTLSSTTEISTGSEIKITVVPGFPNMDGYVAGLSGILQTGEYDTMMSVYNTTTTFATAIDEVERALNKNIVVLSNANFGEGTKTAFETLDSTGNPTLEGAVLYSMTAQDAFGVMMLYNGLTGNSDVIKPEGKAARFGPGALVANSPEEYNQLALLDTSSETYSYTSEEIKNLTKSHNSDLTYEDIREVVDAFSSEDLLTRRGLLEK
ncbi:hypothetical protein [Alkalibacter saccharofermentans]|uniref:Substrate-binding protein domain-containing protein n=1 Tax=Alkalibacter saccharofermentans DSM 14828 TaxID=1120975 RepID=A0A1M4W3M6_9FIRM|nr:hypothetical protein [Alkalibacter saccharofermentans]SHE75809.1 hypothetical protein SAMN02746064_01155 [Alkalibacter saccharofermentans DSM 14828]